MIRRLLAFVAWLDRRYPPTAKVTLEQFAELQAWRNEMATKAADREAKDAALQKRVEDAEKSLQGIKDVMAKAPYLIAENRRKGFIETGTLRE